MLDEAFDYVIMYVKNLLSFNMNLTSQMVFITTNGLLAFLIIRKITGCKYRIKTAIIMCILLIIIAVLAVCCISNIDLTDIIKKLIN